MRYRVREYNGWYYVEYHGWLTWNMVRKPMGYVSFNNESDAIECMEKLAAKRATRLMPTERIVAEMEV